MFSRETVITIATTSSLGIGLVALAYWQRKKKKIPVSDIKFGKEMREAEFFFHDDTTPCNHGSFGAVPRTVFDARYRLLLEYERGPDLFEHFKYPRYHDEACEEVAQFVGAKKENLVFVKNVTTGVSAVLKSLKLNKGDTILVLNLTYPSMVYAAEDTYGANVLNMDLKFPIDSKEDLIQRYRDIFSSNPSIKIAIIDHISSSTALLFPVKELIELCHEFGIQALIDGAHAPGQVALNLEDLQADYYTGSLHKWLYTPRGAAILWVHPKHHDVIKPLVTSHFCRESMQKQFFMQGTLDNSTYLAAPAAIQFYEDIGGMDKIHRYTKSLLDWGIPMLAKAWGTEPFPLPADMRAPYMRMVRIPSSPEEHEISSQWAVDILAGVFDKHRIHCAPVEVQNQLWCRVSVNIYSTKEDLIKLKDAMLDVVGGVDKNKNRND